MFPVFRSTRGSAVPLFSRGFGTFDVNTNRTQIGHNGTEKLCCAQSGYTLPNVWEFALKKRTPSGEACLSLRACAYAVIRPLFSPDNVRTRTHARGTAAPSFFPRQRARARVVCICIICVISERLQSASGAVTAQIRALPCSMIERENAEEKRQRCRFCARLRARIMHVRESGERYHIFTNEKV